MRKSLKLDMEKTDNIEYDKLEEGCYISDNGLVSICYYIKLDNEFAMRLTAATCTLCGILKVGNLYYVRYNGNVTPLTKARFSVLRT